MIISLNARWMPLIAFLVCVAPSAARASSTKLCMSVCRLRRIDPKGAILVMVDFFQHNQVARKSPIIGLSPSLQSWACISVAFRH